MIWKNRIYRIYHFINERWLNFHINRSFLINIKDFLIPLELFKSNHLEEKIHDISLESGKHIQNSFIYNIEFEKFFKEGKRFYIQDTFEKKYYLPKKDVKNIKETLENPKINSSLDPSLNS